MELNALSIIIGIVGTTTTLMLLYWLAGWLKNANRFDRPIFLPRDDEVAWALAMASPRRLWLIPSTAGLFYDNWDLGILKIHENLIQAKYQTKPRMCDVILTPKKWGGHWACVVTKELNSNRYITTFLGEYHENHTITRGRKKDIEYVS